MGCSVDVRFGFATLVPTVVAVTAATLAGGTAGTAYAGATLAATGGSSYTWSKLSGDLPTGLTLSEAGAVAGTPTVAGSYTFTAKALDASGAYAVQSFTIVIEEAP